MVALDKKGWWMKKEGCNFERWRWKIDEYVQLILVSRVMDCLGLTQGLPRVCIRVKLVIGCYKERGYIWSSDGQTVRHSYCDRRDIGERCKKDSVWKHDWCPHQERWHKPKLTISGYKPLGYLMHVHICACCWFNLLRACRCVHLQSVMYVNLPEELRWLHDRLLFLNTINWMLL